MASGSDTVSAAADELQFQNFNENESTKNGKSEFTSFPMQSSDSYDEEADLLSSDSEKNRPPSFWTFEYYQSLFDVDTKQVLQRIVGSALPRPGYMQRLIKSRPDLYGPFWVCATLVFTIAISGNIGDYLRSEGKKKDVWRYDFHKVSFAATAIYTYAWFIPLTIWGLLWYRGSKNNYSLMQIICLYGYSMSIYIPLSILWLIDINWLQWTLVLIGSLLSGSVLLMTLWPSVKEDENKKFGYIILLIIFVLHMLLAVGFMTYFFHGTKHKSDLPIPVSPMTTEKTIKEAFFILPPSNNFENKNLKNKTKKPPSTTMKDSGKKSSKESQASQISKKILENTSSEPTVAVTTRKVKIKKNKNPKGKDFPVNTSTEKKP